MTSTNEQGLSSERVRGPPGIDLDDLHCSICHTILWKPVACQSCEIPFCSACITKWLTTNPANCPTQCDKYIERPCPPFIVKQLAKLQIHCIYQPNGCQEVVLYEALDKHEVQCGHHPQKCSGCQSQISKKDFTQHQAQCELIELACPDCKLVYKRRDTAARHSDMNCLREQLRLLRHESVENERRLAAMHHFLFPGAITFADIPNASMGKGQFPKGYKNLKWDKIGNMHEQYAKTTHPNSGYVAAFTPSGSPCIAYSDSSASISVEDENKVFDLVSLEACAAWRDNLQLIITGHRKSTQIFTHTSTLLFGKSQLIELYWRDIDMLKFESSGGSAHPGSDSRVGLQFILTCLRVNNPR